ncbi:MAG: acyl carrier protein [Bacteroidales bacterium]|nr:acyl carrier protein [Bacteroidales bacterium]
MPLTIGAVNLPLIGSQQAVATSSFENIAPAQYTGPVFAQGQIQDQLRDSLAEALYLQPSEIDADKSFVDLGLDSIIGVEWIKVINKTYGLDISATKVYDYSTIRTLATFVNKEIEKSPGRSVKQEPIQPLTSPIEHKLVTPPAAYNNIKLSGSFPVLKRRHRLKEKTHSDRSLEKSR